MADNATPAAAPLTVLDQAVANQNKIRREAAVRKVEAELVVLGDINDQIAALNKRANEIRERIAKIAAEVPTTAEELLGRKV